MPNRSRLKRVTTMCLSLVMLPVSSALAVYQFAADGGTFVTLEWNGTPVTYQMSYSSGNEPRFHGVNLGPFSLADGHTLVLSGFDNKTYESGGHDVFGGRLAYRVQKAGETGTFATNVNNGWQDLGSGYERHFATNMNVNLLAGLDSGTYEIEVYALAQGNFSPMLVEDNGGTNFIATFTVSEDPLCLDVTEHGKVASKFSYPTNTGYSNELFVVGNHPDVGNWNPVLARKLLWNDGNVWTGQVAIGAGHPLQYKYVIRTNSASGYCDGGNTIWLGAANSYTSIPPQPAAPYAGKAIYYHSGWTNANIVYQCGLDTNWYAKDMFRIGDGRVPGEYLYYVDGIGNPGELLAFVPNGYLNDTQYWDHSPATGGDYYTRLDVLFLQDGQVYNYWPPASVSVSRVVSTNVASSFNPPINGRAVRIYLPRGYDQNTWKKYPVLYMHDGTNVFKPGGIYGCWNAETNADYMISLGMMRETIIVAVDNSSNRSLEFLPPGDTYYGSPGIADQYGNFLIHNVRPTVDTHYRTLNDPDNTAVMGSSFGGQVSLYLGFESNVFGLVGSMSTAPWSATNFMGRIHSNNVHGFRVYLDMGTAEPSLWEYHWQIYDMLLVDGYVVNHDLRSEIGCGHEHNEWAWDLRLPMAYEFLLNIGDEPNLLAQSDNPPELTTLAMSNGAFRVTTDSLKGRRYRLERAGDLLDPEWAGVVTSAVEDLMWSTTTLTDPSPPAGSAFYYRVLAEPWP